MSSVIPQRAIGGRPVPPMAIGCWSWGDKGKWGYDQEKDLKGINEAWAKCNELGITFYDTAEKLFIGTKYLGVPGAGHFFLFRPAINTAVDLSLQRLGVDSIDLYMIHSPLSLHSFKAMAKQLVTAYKAGKIKAVGVSNFGKDEMIQMADILGQDDISLAVNQVEFSLLRQLPERSGLLAEMKKRNITCLAYSPLAMGRLTGKYSAANPPPKGRNFGGNLPWEELDPLLDEMKVLAEKYNVPVSAIALNWVMCKGAIPLGGARNAQQAEQNAKAMTFRLTEEEVKSLGAKGAEGKTDWWQHG